MVVRITYTKDGERHELEWVTDSTWTVEQTVECFQRRTQAPPSLPPFVSSRATHSLDRPTGARGRLQSWEAVRTDKIIRRRAEALAKADARRRLLSQAFTVACCLVAISVAGVTLHREADLQRQAREMLR